MQYWFLAHLIPLLHHTIKSWLQRRRERIEEARNMHHQAIKMYVLRLYEETDYRDDVIARILVESPLTTSVIRTPGYITYQHMQLFYLLHRLRVRPRRVAQ